jgi:UDP-sulfoquinovose synthase
MQGPVYGYAFDDEDAKDLKSQFGTSFYYDEIFGTVINRFLVQAISDTPLTIYGGGGQIRGFLNIKDVLQCIELIVTNPPKAGEFRVINQFTQMFSIEDLASMVATAAFNIGLSPTTYQKIKNPRVELEKHPYDVEYTILEKMGLMSKPLTISILEEMLLSLLPLKDEVNKRIIQPTIQWDK